MISVIKNLLAPAPLRELEKLIDQGTFEDGKKTAGWAARDKKRNRQWHANQDLTNRINQLLTQALASNADFTASSYPKALQPFLISETSGGGSYGAHVDDALMGEDQILRSDVSCTVFLSDAAAYSGGELQITNQGATLRYKLNAGDAIVYPSTTLHEVRPVTVGLRRVAVTWIESYIRGAEQREMLHDLYVARRLLFASEGKDKALERVNTVHANLLRRWAQT